MKVYVKSVSGEWLMPTNPANARVLLRQKRAKVISRVPFSVQLLYETSEFTQPVIVGIDDGGVNIGIAAVSVSGETLYQEEAKLRTDIKSKLKTRRELRRNRRNRKCRYRKKRFNNRAASRGVCKVCGGNTKTSHVLCGACLEGNGHHVYSGVEKTVFRIPPSIRAKKDAVIRMVRQIPLPVPEKIIIEDAYFDIQAIENPEITGEEYQRGPLLYHKNYKSACLTRDGHNCRKCGSSDNLRVHHIKHRSDGGTDKLSNLMTLCEKCHKKYHSGSLKLPKQKKSLSFVSAAHVMQGKNFLHNELCKVSPLKKTFGYLTSYFRKKFKVSKSHTNDALIIANRKAKPLPVIIRTLHVRRQKRDLHKVNPHKIKGIKNHDRKRMNAHIVTRDGLCKNDAVFFEGKLLFVSGFASPGRCYLRDTDGKYLMTKTGKSKASKHVKYLTRLHGNRSLVRSYVSITEKRKPVVIGDQLLLF